MKWKTGPIIFSTAAALSLILTSCGTADGTSDSGSDSSQQHSVAQGASKEEYIEAFTDIEPVTLTFQSPAPSGENFFGQREIAWAETINEWSGGKVTVDVVWNGSVAEPTEIPDALADGRLDLATYAFVYDRERFPVSNAISNSIVSTPASPFVGELVTDAAVVETAWNTPEFLEEMEANDLVPIVPFIPGGSSGLACTEPRTTANDLDGVQSRVSMEAQGRQLTELGGSPVSLDFSELYEALQRGVTDCSISALSTMVNGALPPVAPHIAMPREEQIAVGPQGFLGGTSFEQLPLPVQQLIYDKGNDWYMMNYQAIKMFANEAATVAEENGGGITSGWNNEC
jgi:TRAP-type C4-dicarboxylate transport system substrate-binding protein